MTERQIAKESGYSPGIVHRKLAQGQTAAEIIRAGKLRPSRLAAAAALAGEAGGSKRAGETYAEAQARKETALASLRELQLAERRGALIQRETVESEWTSVCTTIRDAMLGLPTKLCSRLAAMTDEPEITKYLRVEIRAELTRASKQLDGPAPAA
jgi:phage terminase Nu1 subunit (DNA packaging protein)